MRIKICGITRPEDAALADRAGADAIGQYCFQTQKEAWILILHLQYSGQPDPTWAGCV